MSELFPLLCITLKTPQKFDLFSLLNGNVNKIGVFEEFCGLFSDLIFAGKKSNLLGEIDFAVAFLIVVGAKIKYSYDWVLILFVRF